MGEVWISKRDAGQGSHVMDKRLLVIDVVEDDVEASRRDADHSPEHLALVKEIAEKLGGKVDSDNTVVLPAEGEIATRFLDSHKRLEAIAEILGGYLDGNNRLVIPGGNQLAKR